MFVKVNAPVDTGIGDLVAVPSKLPRLETIKRCQGDETGGVLVCFHLGAYWDHPWRELAEFVLNHLGPGLAR